MNTAKAVAAGLTTFAWYALPDVVRSRGLRGVLKAGVLGAFGAAWAAIDEPSRTAPGPDKIDTVLEAIRQNPGGTAAVAGVAVATSSALGVAGEKAIFGFGERRRARGVRCAHTLPALVLGSIAAVGVLLEPVVAD